MKKVIKKCKNCGLENEISFYEYDLEKYPNKIDDLKSEICSKCKSRDNEILK